VRIPFTYYVHDDANTEERARDIGEQIGRPLTDEEIQKIGRPFYEVTLYCELDTETGEVSLIRAEL